MFSSIKVVHFLVWLYITECRSKGGVLLIIPKGAIITVADAMQKLLDRVIQEGSLTAWGKLLGFCYWGIRRPEGQKSEVVGNVSGYQG